MQNPRAARVSIARSSGPCPSSRWSAASLGRRQYSARGSSSAARRTGYSSPPPIMWFAAARRWRPCKFGSGPGRRDRKSTRLNSSHVKISYAVFCLKKKKKQTKKILLKKKKQNKTKSKKKKKKY